MSGVGLESWTAYFLKLARLDRESRHISETVFAKRMQAFSEQYKQVTAVSCQIRITDLALAAFLVILVLEQQCLIEFIFQVF